MTSNIQRRFKLLCKSKQINPPHHCGNLLLSLINGKIVCTEVIILGSSPCLKGRERPQCPGLTSSSTTQNHIQGLVLIYPNIYPIFDLLEYAKELILWYPQYLHDSGRLRDIWEEFCKGYSDDAVLETRPMAHCHKHLQVQLIGQKVTLRDTPRFPVPLRRTKSYWKGKKDRGAKWVSVCLVLIFQLFCLFVCFFGGAGEDRYYKHEGQTWMDQKKMSRSGVHAVKSPKNQ